MSNWVAGWPLGNYQSWVSVACLGLSIRMAGAWQSHTFGVDTALQLLTRDCPSCLASLEMLIRLIGNIAFSFWF